MFPLHVVPAAVWLQTAGAADRETLLVIFVGIIALFFLILIAVLLGAVIYAIRIKKQVLASIEGMKRSVLEKATPIVGQAHGLVTEFTPKVRSITDDVVEISHTVRAQISDIDSTLSHVTASARSQADRVNGMVSSTLNTTSNVAQSIEKGVRVPIREVSGVLAGLKAGLDVLSGRTAAPSASRIKRAEEPVAQWEREISAEANRAAQVNQPVHTASAALDERLSGVAERSARSVMEAGEETAGGREASPGRDSIVESRGEEVIDRRPV